MTWPARGGVSRISKKAARLPDALELLFATPMSEICAFLSNAAAIGCEASA